MTASTPKPQENGASNASENPQQKHTEHSDDKRSAMPERDDKSREQSPADRPGKQSGEGEPPVG
ncbi:hypothetical protein M3I53_05875 [Paraburkholderia sp. CNPSo 3272]|uniref:hypothetical protein n=1 Tax=Paraburkholderia sp. CNPSo 3272 TaxID=2940931 RepID=UPI0020B8B7F3|nr:hypothetical protein [Paraburkholderia sp. CNPSo 3272]MCP3722664.1 hypothetical protein [Paraburkholderia sp. CNPSo 3272]